MLRLLKISGDSLSPEFNHGDFVLVSKIPYYLFPPSIGEVIAFRQPGYGILIKRIQAVHPDGGFEVIGSHPDSVDSRVFGPVLYEKIIGKVIWHITRA
jgi:nickel-type superoxide dismutase maturation protease